MKQWWILGLLATIFCVIGVGGIVLGRQDQVGYAVGGVFLVAGLGMWWSVRQMRREESIGESPAHDVAPSGVSFAEVAERIRARLAGTPYDVGVEGSIIRVRADLADAAFLTWAAAHRVRDVRSVEVVAVGPGKTIMRDLVQGFEVTGGTAGLTGRAHTFSGRSWSYTRRIEYGAGGDGSVGKQVDIDFNSSEIQKPVIEVLKETGWYTSWFAAQSAETRGAIGMAVFAGAGAIVAVVVALVQTFSG